MSALKVLADTDDAVFDRRHFEHYTMHNQGLASEVLELFLSQLPATLQLLSEATTAADWKFAAHALKGSAAAVGARRLQKKAVELEAMDFADVQVRLLRLQALRALVAEFRDLARSAYPASPA